MSKVSFSLCIPTMDRFENFLSINLPKYLDNELIDEIIICDENGNDYNKLKKNFSNNPKIKLFKNETTLGPFLNKIKVCKYAKNEWIVLIDSDNFADKDYFITAYNYIINNNISNTSIISPSFAKPVFNYKQFQNNIITKKNINNYKNNNLFLSLMNTGNYVLNKYLYDNINISNEKNINQSHSTDVIYVNTLFFEQYPNFEFHIIQNLEYDHSMHDGSIYLEYCEKFIEFSKKVHNRFKNI
jgi:hypothetical protein